MGLSADQVTVMRGGRPVLDGVSVAFAPGRVSVVLGPNGAGKSTLAGVLTGLLTPDAGRATLNGADVRTLDPRDRARRIGYLAQDAEVHWDLCVEELVALGRLPHRGPFAALGAADKAAIDAALAATDTARFVGRRVLTLSGGEAARVQLARVFAGQPEWIIADEPLEGLDPGHRLDLLDRLRAAAAAGTGIVLILHDLAHAARVADDALLIAEGRVAAQGPARDVLTPDRLEPVYGVRFFNGTDTQGRPLLVPTDRL